ncbi:MAG: hypothetical protein ABTQ27_04115 [Amaricoccus sp.]|uniref:hypothetical protein n=1 Tax=Amaricoccus sp. TaxID=1872485 RepID=UPI0033158571
MAEPVDALEEIAADMGNWRMLGIRLLGAMTNPSLYGFSRSDEVLAEVARLRGQTPESLMNSVRAARYLVEHAPAELRRLRDDPGIGLSHVNLLARLDDIDTEEVQTLKVRVFNGEMTYRQLAAKVRAIQEGAGAAVADICLRVGPPERVLGRKRAKSFEWTLKQFLTARLKDLTGRPKAKLESGQKQLPVPVDYIVRDSGVSVIAIEAKAPRRTFRQSVLVDMLGTCSLLQRRVPEVWLITPHGWEAGLEKIASIADEMHQPGLRFFTFDEATAVSGTSALREIQRSGEPPVGAAKEESRARRGRRQA